MYFELLNDKDKQRVLSVVNKHFDRNFYHKTEFKHNDFKQQFPYEYKNVPIGDLKGKAKEFNEYLFNESLKWIEPVMDKLREGFAKKKLAKGYKTGNHSTLKRFLKYQDKV